MLFALVFPLFLFPPPVVFFSFACVLSILTCSLHFHDKRYRQQKEVPVGG